jgi:hypothetical protein
VERAISAFLPPASSHSISSIKPSLHRSRFFLIGLLPIVLLLWAWADSMGATTMWQRSSRDLRTSIVNDRSKIMIAWTDAGPGTSGKYSPFVPEHPLGNLRRRPDREDKVARKLFPDPDYLKLPSPVSSKVFRLSHYLALPHWFLLVLYLPLWLGLSYWRSRSKLKRLAAALPEPGAAAV